MKVKMYEIFYGWKAGTKEIDERGNTNIIVDCCSIKSVIDELEFLKETQRNAKRGILKSLEFTINTTQYDVNDTRFSISGRNDVGYSLFIDFPKKIHCRVADIECYNNICDALDSVLEKIKTYYVKSKVK